MDFDKLIAQPSLSICQRQGLCLFPIRCCVWETWDPIVLSLGRSKQLLQRIESHRWHADGIRVENLPRTHYSGYPQVDSEKRWANFWFSAVHRQDHFHFNVQRHCMGCERKRKGGTPHTIANPTDLRIGLQRKWCNIPKTWQYTSQHVMKIVSWSSGW